MKWLMICILFVVGCSYGFQSNDSTSELSLYARRCLSLEDLSTFQVSFWNVGDLPYEEKDYEDLHVSLNFPLLDASAYTSFAIELANSGNDIRVQLSHKSIKRVDGNGFEKLADFSVTVSFKSKGLENFDMPFEYLVLVVPKKGGLFLLHRETDLAVRLQAGTVAYVLTEQGKNKVAAAVDRHKRRCEKQAKDSGIESLKNIQPQK